MSERPGGQAPGAAAFWDVAVLELRAHPPPLSLCVSFPGRHVQPRARDSAPVAHGRARGSYNVASHTRLPALLQRTGGPFMPRVVGNMVWTGRAANRRRYKPEARSLRIPSRGPRRGPSSPVADRRPPPSSAWGQLAESSPITCSLHLSVWHSADTGRAR